MIFHVKNINDKNSIFSARNLLLKSQEIQIFFIYFSIKYEKYENPAK